ncbi:MAG: LysR family transcriptional regulator [Verrucomicrobia bacterium]|nr:LysR family transcriptional regulator [Verrucomicrobiota bacterium]
MNIPSIDTNLLAQLATILEERSVTRAAERLNLTQPAVSNALARARELLNDPLLVREGRNLVPTPLALQLEPMLEDLMIDLRGIMELAHPVDPSDVDRTFTLACADNVMAGDLANMTANLRRDLPFATLRVVSIDYFLARDGLVTGLVDCVMGPPGSLPGMRFETLYSEFGRIALRNELLQSCAPTQEAFNEAEHVDVHITMGKGGEVHSVFEQVLLCNKLSRKVRVIVPTFTAAAYLAAQSELWACLPERFANTMRTHLPLQVWPLPFDCPQFDTAMMWHPRTDRDPASKYFRSVLKASFRSHND